MKRSIFVLVAFLAVASLAFAADKIKLSVWTTWPEGDPLSKTYGLDYFDALKEFQKLYPNVEFNTDRMTNEIWKQKIQIALAGDAAPDVFQLPAGTFMFPFADAGKLLALDPYLDAAFKSNILISLHLYTYNGKLYTLPMEVTPAFLYCNRDMFKQYGLQYPKTFDDLLSVVKAFKAKGITGPLAMGVLERWPTILFYEQLVVMFGGYKNIQPQVTAKKLDIANEPAYLKAAKAIRQLVDAGAFRPDVLSVSMFAEGFQAFKDGKAPMMYHGSWMSGAMETADSSILGKVDVLPFPMVNDKSAKGSERDLWGGSFQGFAVSAKTKEPKIAAEFAKFLVLYLNKNGYQKGYMMPVYKVDVKPEQVKSDIARQQMALLNKSTSVSGAWDFQLEQNDVQNYLENITKLLGGELTPEQFVQTLPH